ncbi:hypothetical protein ACVWY0_004419 [Arthrobacter sp. UYNi723]
MDGTCLDLADTPANEHPYGRPGTAPDLKSSYPQARVLGLVECGTHAVTGAVVSGSSASGHDLYPGLLHRLEEDMLAMADRGFFSYTAWKDRAGIGAALLWRVKANAVLLVLEEVEDGSYLSAVYPTPKARRNNTDPIRDRVVEYTVTTWETTSDFRLITSILAPAAAPAQDLAEAYARRWEIESCFDELKTHQRGPGIVLRSKTPGRVLQKIYGYLCVHYAVRSLISTVAEHFDEDPFRFSFTRTLRAARRSLAGRPAFSP